MSCLNWKEELLIFRRGAGSNISERSILLKLLIASEHGICLFFD